MSAISGRGPLELGADQAPSQREYIPGLRPDQGRTHMVATPTEHVAIVGMVQQLSHVAGDPEAAHSLQDRIYETALEAIANGADNADLIAQTALQAADIDFPRWYA